MVIVERECFFLKKCITKIVNFLGFTKVILCCIVHIDLVKIFLQTFLHLIKDIAAIKRISGKTRKYVLL